MATQVRRETEQAIESAPDRSQSLLDKVIEYTPQGEKEPIRLNGALVLRYLVTPTKSGAKPSEQDIVRFLMLCKARELTEAADRRALAALDFANAAIECIPDGTPIKLLGETALALLREVDR
jgi:hypothetical protein